MNNSITIIGHVGQNPKETNFPSGRKVANFSVAVKEYGTSQEQQPLWFEVQAWNGLADRVLSNITKGREVGIQGRLEFVQYKIKNSNSTKVKPTIILSGYHLCGRKPSSGEKAE